MKKTEKQNLIDNFVEDLGRALYDVIKDHMGEMGLLLLIYDPTDIKNNHFVTNASDERIVEALRLIATMLEKRTN